VLIARESDGDGPGRQSCLVQVTQLEKEILEQPEAIRRLLSAEGDNVRHIAEAIRRRSPHFAMFVARGSSDNAARYGQYIFGINNGLPVALATPSLYTLYGKPPRLDNALVLAVSQSGQSPDIVSVVETGRQQGAVTVAITNDMQSPLAAAAEYCIGLQARTEKSIAATKTYTTSLISLAMLSTLLAEDEGSYRGLQDVPEFITEVTATTADTIRATERYRYMEACVVLSRGYNYATAFEIALKLKELTYVLAEPYSSADFQHGPVALVERGFPVLAVVPDGALAAELVDFLKKLRDRGAELVVISAQSDALSLAQTRLPIPPSIPEWLSPVVAVVRGQLFALGLTLAKGFDPDHPRSLRKVTLTE
jgi:glucosamine--fructose-6-phosphate aminotransferase (isomerizing)